MLKLRSVPEGPALRLKSVQTGMTLRAVSSLKGPPNVLSIGTVESGETSAASITGNSPSQVLNLTLEKGEDGATVLSGDGAPVSDGKNGDIYIDLETGDWYKWVV